VATRIYLAGRLAVEHEGRLVLQERDFPGRQGRLAFACLAANRSRSVPRDELVTALWGASPPAELDATFSAVLSKLRALLRHAGLISTVIELQHGTVEMRLPAAAWIDLEAAANAVDEAEGALRSGDAARAWSFANVVVSIARRGFLPDEEAPWIEARRTRLRLSLSRALQCLSAVSAERGEQALAVEYVGEVIALEPFRETAYRELMRLHARMGNRAEALRVFGRCRQLLRDELGANPSPQTEAVFLAILRDNSTA
jgi:SARP family transcriptional regulator, regulator of embCAB operon